jgi:hypothetical protein
MEDQQRRLLLGLIWMLVFVVLLIGGYRLFHLKGPSADQRLLREKSKP